MISERTKVKLVEQSCFAGRVEPDGEEAHGLVRYDGALYPAHEQYATQRDASASGVSG